MCRVKVELNGVGLPLNAAPLHIDTRTQPSISAGDKKGFKYELVESAQEEEVDPKQGEETAVYRNDWLFIEMQPVEGASPCHAMLICC